MGCGIDGYIGLNPDWNGSLEAMAMAEEDVEVAGTADGGGTGVEAPVPPDPKPPAPPPPVIEAISLLASFKTSDKLVVFEFPPSVLLLC